MLSKEINKEVMRLFITILLTATSIYSQAQQALHIKVTGGNNRAPLPASILIKGTTTGHSADSKGMASVSFANNGSYILVTSSVGYIERETKVTIPHSFLKDYIFLNLS